MRMYTEGMARTSEFIGEADLDTTAGHLLDLYPHLWHLTADRRERARHVLLTSSGDTVSVTKEYDEPLPVDCLTLEPGQIIVEVSALEEAPQLRVLRISGEAHWRIAEIARFARPEHVIPLDDGLVLVMDGEGEASDGSQLTPQFDRFDGIDHSEETAFA